MDIMDDLDYFEDIQSLISKSLKLLEIHRKVYLCGENEGILLDHFMSIKHGLEFLEMYFKFSHNENLVERVRHSVFYVRQRLYSLRNLGKDESLDMHLDREYSDLREQMKNVVINPGTNEYGVIFLGIFARWFEFCDTCLFLCEKIKVLLSLDCKADQITPMMKELEDIWMLIYLLEPFFICGIDMPLIVKDEEKDIFSTITAMLDRATCFIYLSFIGKMNDEIALSWKHSVSDLRVAEAQIMKMYFVVNVGPVRDLKSHISMAFRLLEWNKKCYLGTEMGVALDDHFISIEYGLEFLVKILELPTNRDLKLRIRCVVAIVKYKLHSLPHMEEDENLIVNLEHAYSGMREEMQNIVFKPGTDDYDMLSQEILIGDDFSKTEDLIFQKIMILTSICMASRIAPMMKELEELRKKWTSLKPLFDYVRRVSWEHVLTDDEKKVMAALTTFVDRATCLIYLSFVSNLNEDMLVSLRKNISLLIEETEIKKMSLNLDVFYEDDLNADIDISLSLLKRQEEYHLPTITESKLKDHIMRLKHGVEFLRWIPEITIHGKLKRHIILLAVNVKQKLELLTFKQGDESLNMNVDSAYADLREEMKNVIINLTTGEFDILFPALNMISDFRGYNDFLDEKITTLVTSNCEADQIAPLNKELQDLRKMLTSLKPLCHYNYEIEPKVSIIHHKASLLIYLSFVGKMDIEMVLSVKSNISTAVEETNPLEIYTMVLKRRLHRDYLDSELCILENLILVLISNFGYLNDANQKLYEVLSDIHSFLLALSPNVILRKRHLLAESSEDILHHSIPIICSCYLEHTEVDVSAEFNFVLDRINHIKYEAQEIKLYYFSRVDDLGFLEFFSGYLEDLMNNKDISMTEEIVALHFEVHSLASLAKVTNQELNRTPWNDIINMVYQAEYIIDHYLVRSSRDSQLISSLSKITEKLKNMKVNVDDVLTLDLSCLSINLPAHDVLGMATQISNKATIVSVPEEDRILEHLVMGESKLEVISIVGMAGVGKTTLASTLYKTPSIADHFDILAWCTVSQSYQNKALLLSILDQVNPLDKNHRIIMDDNTSPTEHLYRSLKKRRYLIVLDDMWDTMLWNYLKHYLPDDRKGSRILITTRNKDVALKIGSKVNELHGLSNEQSWELFEKKMLQNESLSGDLLNIAKGITENCKGLPLSIVVIAGILSDTERTKKKWNEIAESVNSLILSDTQGKCKAILELSYNHLPNHLRSCFLYLGSFPEDKEILVNRLICLWIAEGLVRDTKSDSADEVANNYIKDLFVKSLVIPAKVRSGGSVKSFFLHDLLRDFCLDKAKENHFLTFFDKTDYSRQLQDPRRFVIDGPNISPQVLDFSCHSIRSMICYGLLDASEIEKVIESCDMVLLRVLVVGEISGKFFPNISSLVHLRYLDLGLVDLFISFLPTPICKLQNVEVLILRFSYEIEVPDLIWDMVKLCHVDIRPEASFEVASSRLENSSFLLESLRSLSVASVSCADYKWLMKLLGLQKLSCVFRDLKDNPFYQKDNQFRMLNFNSHLTSLKVKNGKGWKQRFIKACELPTSLRELTLLKFYLKSDDISEIGRAVPHLEIFNIYNCLVPSGYNWNVDDEAFPKLKILKLRDVKITKWTASEDSFPSLEKLWVEKCDYLDNIPLDFGYLPNLCFISVRECASSVEDSAREIEKQQHEDQNTEMRVLVYPRK